MITTKLHPRRRARIAVLEALYAREMTGEPKEKILADLFQRSTLDQATCNYIRVLFDQVLSHRQGCEQLIIDHLANWDYERVALIDRLILTLAISEIYYVEEVPPKVSITEAIEIAKQYSTAESSRFVNGILDAIYKEKLPANDQTPAVD